MKISDSYVKTIGEYNTGRGGVRRAIRSSLIDIMHASKSGLVKPALRTFYCHYVFNDQVVDFRQKIEYLLKIGRFISTREMLDLLKYGEDIKENLFHISFDDGFKNIATNAIPILAEYSIPSLIFVPTDFIGKGFDSALCFANLRTSNKNVIEFCNLDDLRKATKFGATIGSHTRSHSRLSSLEEEPMSLKSEIMDSKRIIEDNMSQSCDYFSWPYGRLEDFSNEARLTAVSAGYNAVFGAYRAQMKPGITDIYSIPRNHFEPEWKMSHFKYFAEGGFGG